MRNAYFGAINNNALDDLSSCLSTYRYSFKSERLSIAANGPIIDNDNYVQCILGSITASKYKNWKDSHLPQLIEKAYQSDPQHFNSHFDGDFLIIYYCKKSETLTIANNAYQCTNGYIAPLNPKDESSFNDGLIFSNDYSQLTKAIKSCAKALEVNYSSIKSFISNGFTMTQQTQVCGIEKILPCFSYQFKNQLKRFDHSQMELEFNKSKFNNLNEKLDQYEKLYSNGIEEYLSQKKPNELGTLLSGGHDTSFAFIKSSQVFNKKLHAMSVVFPDWAWDEESYAKNICNKFGGTFHPISFGPNDLEYICDLISANQEPVVGSSLPLHKLGHYAKDHVDTLFGGDGGDTLWGEYYPVAEYHRYIKNAPLKVRKFIHKFSQGLVKLTDWERFWELEHVSKLFCKEDYYNGFMRSLCTYRHFNDDFQNELFIPEIANASIDKPLNEVKFTKENFNEALISGKLFNAFYTYQSFSTYRSIEHFDINFHLPTINRELMRFITNLPNQWVNGGTSFHRLTNNKTINRRFHKMALTRYLRKEEIYNRSFDIPWYNILKPRHRVLENLKIRLINRGWYQEKFLNKLFSEFQAQRVKDYELLELKHHGYRIFTLLSLEIWAMQYLDDLPSDLNGTCLEDYLAI